MGAGDLGDRRVLVVGAGLMGRGIAQVFASRGCAVSLTDVGDEILARSLEEIRRSLVRLAEWGLGEPGEVEPTLARIRITTDLDAAAPGVDLAVEAVSEDLRLKREVFRRLDALCPPEAILASNTSVISITEIAQGSLRQERIVGTHFWNPAVLVPLVEVVPGERTSAQVVEAAVSLLRSAGKHPVRLKKDVPGFVGNRLQHALWREAISIVEHGIADPDVVDEVVKHGFGLRLPVLGPLENADLVGLDLTLAVHDYLFKHLEASPHPSPLLVERVAAGELGFKSGRGFRQWSPPEMARVRSGLEKHLLRVLKDR
jgi:3-hydroxybutyryl-CoA dehydrogenase